METAFNNWILNKHVGKFTVASNEYPQFYKEKLTHATIPLVGNRLVINWDKMDPKYSFLYEFENSSEIVRTWLRSSILSKQKEILIEFGYHQPIVSFEINCFIDNWYDFASFEGFVGTLCFTPDCQQILEFTDRREYHLYSNFEIKPL